MELRGGADRDGRFTEDDVIALELGHQVRNHGLNVGHIRRVGTTALRSSDAQKVQIAELGCFFVVRAEIEASGLDIALQNLGQARFIEWNLARFESGNLIFIYVHA